MRLGRLLLVLLLVQIIVMPGRLPPAASPKPEAFPDSPLYQPDFFPLGVWLQDPPRAGEYKALGINLYVGLWKGPRTDQLARLKAAGMPVITRMSNAALMDPNRDIIVAWMQEDEPDNVQGVAGSSMHGPPIPPNVLIREYGKMRERDPSRPILLNLGQGVAWDAWHGRGPRTNHPEDYVDYVKAADIVSFDIYPVTHMDPEVSGNLSFVAKGVDRLVKWTGGGKPVWSLIAVTRVANPKIRPTVDEVRSQVWLSIIHGATGIVYFVHQFKPVFVEAALLEDAGMSAAVAAINAQLTALAPVLKSESLPDLVSSQPKNPSDRDSISTLVKRDDCHLYIFAGSRSRFPGTQMFHVKHSLPDGDINVLEEDRALGMREGRFEDSFGPYAVHLYKLPMPTQDCPRED